MFAIRRLTESKFSNKVEKHSNSFLDRIQQLEDEKMMLVLQGAEYRPELLIRFEKIDRKLEKYYAWYARAYLSGKV